MYRYCLKALFLCLACLLLPVVALAAKAPAGPVILTITGAIDKPNAGSQAQFDDAMLAALPQHQFTTGSPWYRGLRTFRGPLLADVLAAAGARGRLVKATALDDLRVTIPLSDALRYGVILAREVDGRRLRVRDRGPLLVVYPYDSNPALQSGQYYSRSLWQLKTLHVEP